MKVTDYAPRAAPFDSYLEGRDLIGVEVGVDVGAHAEALLAYCPIAMLYLVDPWLEPYAHGYCVGRLARYRARTTFLQLGSLEAARTFEAPRFDFVYIDQKHDAQSVRADLETWFPLVKPGGKLGHRNYAQGRGAPLDVAIENFVAERGIKTKIERYLNDIVLFRPA